MTGSPPVAGIVLAAGEGRRFGKPKALVADAAGQTWVARTVEAMLQAGLSEVYVVVGAQAADVRQALGTVTGPSRLAPPLAARGVQIVEADGWREGMGASLRAGLSAVAGRPGLDAVLLMLVDTPGIGPEVIRRIAAQCAPTALARASYDGQPGHPVLLGRDHWAAAQATAQGDQGARSYLAAAAPVVIECSDIGSGADIDTPAAWAGWQRDAIRRAQVSGSRGPADEPMKEVTDA